MGTFRYLTFTLILLFSNILSATLIPTIAELDGINKGRLEISVIEVNGQVGAYGNGNNDDSAFFNRAIQLYKQYNKGGFIVLDKNSVYLINNKILIKEQPGITLQGRGEGLLRSTIKINITGNIPGIHIYKSSFSSIRKLRIIATSNHQGDSIRVDKTGKTIIHDIDFDNIYNGIRMVISNNLIVSKITMTEPKGNYGFYGVGLEPIFVNDKWKDRVNHIFSMVDIRGTATSNTTFNWITLGQYSVSYHLYDIYFSGGKKGIVTQGTFVDDAYPKYIFATNINISNTASDGIHLKTGLDFQFTDFNVENSGGHGINIDSDFTGGFIMTNPRIFESYKHGVYIGGGEQIQVFNPEIGHNSMSGLSQYSGIYVENGVNKFNIHYGVIGQLDLNTTNNQKYGIELAGVMGTDHKHFTVVDVYEKNNQVSHGTATDPSSNWHFKLRNNRVAVKTNDKLMDISLLVSDGKNYPEKVTYVDLATETLQSVINNLCNDGGTIWLSPVKYTITNDLNLHNCRNLRIMGSGKCINSNTCSTIFFNTPDSKINIQNSSNTWLNNMTFRSNNQHNTFAVHINKSDNTTVSDNYFARLNSGIKIDKSTHTLASNNTLSTITSYGYLLKGNELNPTSNTAIFRTYYSGPSYIKVINDVPVQTQNYTGTLTKIESNVIDTTIIHTTAIRAETSLHVDSPLGSSNEPINIKGYLIATDHSSKEGILINSGQNIQLTNLWIGSSVNINNTAHAGIKINGGYNIDIGNAYIRGIGGHGLHVVDVDSLYAYNFMIGYNGRFSAENTCQYDGIRLESNSDNVVLRGGTSSNLFKPWSESQRRGITILSNNDVFVKGIDLHDNCLSPAYGIPWLKQYNPGWL